MANVDELREELGDVFRKAENAIKEYELTPDLSSSDQDEPGATHKDPSGLFIPAVNQLRYAGFHYIKADALKDPAEKTANLEKAINHCHRAYFDTKEAMLLEQLGIFEEFRAAFAGSPNLIKNYPDYTEDYAQVNKIKKQIIEIRREIYADRHDLFDRIDPHLEKLQTIVNKTSALRPTLAAQDTKDSRKYLIALATLLIMILGILAHTATSITNKWIETCASAGKLIEQPSENQNKGEELFTD